MQVETLESASNATRITGRPSAVRDGGWLTLAGALATAGLLRAVRGYRSFPSIDDFAYVPMALSRLDAQLYPRDVLLRETPLHMVGLPPLVAILRATTGLELGFWLITIALSLLTVVAMYRLMRALELPGALLPLAAILACAGWLQGLGRGEYDGVFGDAFHFQWVAICALLWAYDGLLRERWARAGALLVFSVVSHPLVGVHGIFAMAWGLVFARVAPTRARSWLIPTVVAVCGLLGVLVSFPVQAPDGEAIAGLPESIQALLFRTHEFDIDRFRVSLLLVIAAAGVSGIERLSRRTLRRPVATLLGLLMGHLLLLAAYCVLYEAHVVRLWASWTLVPYELSLSRTTPILLALSSVSIAAALEVGFLAASSGQPLLRGRLWLAARGVQVAAVVCLAVFQVKWSWQVALCCAIATGTAVAIRRQSAQRLLAALWLVALVAGLGLFARSAPLVAHVDDDQEQLFRWARSNTPLNALFVVPPSFQQFRFYAQRSVYVDFKMMTLRMVLWRQRLEQVAAPDRLALDARGWEGLSEWERTYAGRNTPERIASLLRDTGADYFVWDRDGLRIPPMVHRDRARDPSLALAYENRRYEVYRLVH